jgi:hypothetical protein
LIDIYKTNILIQRKTIYLPMYEGGLYGKSKQQLWNENLKYFKIPAQAG